MRITKRVLENQVAFINKFANPSELKLKVYRSYEWYNVGYIDQQGNEKKTVYGMTAQECWYYLIGINDGLALALPF